MPCRSRGRFIFVRCDDYEATLGPGVCARAGFDEPVDGVSVD
jgi:hypothetical protein